jgi:multidrug efflux pump subunit AcrB
MLMDACHKRARPIVMTTIAMGAGMLPIAMGWGADPSFRQPMAVAVIGGLITSTFLSLLVIRWCSRMWMTWCRRLVCCWWGLLCRS